MISSIGVPPLHPVDDLSLLTPQLSGALTKPLPFLPWLQQFDVWVLQGNPIQLQPYRWELFHQLAQAHGKKYRGNHICTVGLEDNWNARESRTELVTRCLPDAIAWDCLWELQGHTGRIEHQGQTVEQFARQAVRIARRYTAAPLYLSEYRPQERMGWILDFCRWIRQEGLDIAGVSIQLHSNLLSAQMIRKGKIVDGCLQLKALGFDVQLFECVVYDTLIDRPHLRGPVAMREALQAQRYREYRDIAERVGASLFGPWFLSDRCAEHWGPLAQGGQCRNPGILREDLSLKPAAGVFLE